MEERHSQEAALRSVVEPGECDPDCGNLQHDKNRSEFLQLSQHHRNMPKTPKESGDGVCEEDSENPGSATDSLWALGAWKGSPGRLRFFRKRTGNDYCRQRCQIEYVT
jgi:hypothetical protein